MTKHKTSATTDRLRAAGYYSAQEVAAKLGIHVASVQRWIAAGEVKGMKLAGRNYVSADSLFVKIGPEAAAIFFGARRPAPVLAKKKDDIQIEED